MDEAIEISIELPGGSIADCRLEPEMTDDDVLNYSATILYPQLVNGYNRSDIYCYTMSAVASVYDYHFNDANNDIYPGVKQLEPQLTAAIKKHLVEIGYRG